MRSRRPPWLSFALCALVISGCPRRFDPRAEEFHSRNPEAEALYQRARTAFSEKNYAAAEQALRDFEVRFGARPDEPLLGPVRLLQARTARLLGDPARSKALLEPLTRPDPQTGALNPGIAETARYELGLTAYRLGDFERARDLLPPFTTQIVDGEEATELHAVMADVWRRSQQPRLALDEYLRYYRGVSVRPLEQAYIRTQALPLLAALPVAEQGRYRAQLGLETKPEGGAARPEPTIPRTLIGAVLPLSGKERALGERVLRGALWAAAAFRGDGTSDGTLATIELRVRDSGGSAEAAERAVAELAQEGAQAILGSPSRADAQAIATRAAALGLPALHTAPSVTAPPANGFQLLRSNKARAEGLARFLTRSGLGTVAVLAPQSTYGQAMTAAFTDVLRGSSVKVVLSESFAENATTFRAQAQKLLEAQPAALFIPTSASQLELIAAQLASSGVLATQRVTAKEGSQPPVRLLLSSAEGLSERLLKSAGRYLQGAVLAPISAAGLPVLADSGPLSLATLFAGYAAEVGEAPGALDALGYDAVRLLRVACGRAAATGGGCTAATLPQLVRTVSPSGATGALAFDASGLRAGEPLLYKIEGASLRAQPMP